MLSVSQEAVYWSNLLVYRRIQAGCRLEEEIQKLEAAGRRVVDRQGGQLLPGQKAQGKVRSIFQECDISHVVDRLEQITIQDPSRFD